MQKSIFISFRFGEARAEALAIQAELNARDVGGAFISDAAAGENLGEVIADAIINCSLAVVLASSTYGQRTNDLFDTGRERDFILAKKKKFFLVRMIPFGESWAEAHITMAFPPAIMFKLWLPGEPMPEDLVDEVAIMVATRQPGSSTPHPIGRRLSGMI